MWLPVTWTVLGLVGVVWGADWFVKGASGLARSLGISTLVIGLTVVAFGTSAAELAVALRAAFAGQSDLAVGNVVGSNIANVLLILGFTAFLSPVRVATRVVRFDVPLVLAASVAVWVLAQDGTLDRREGQVLFGLLVVLTVGSVLASRRAARKAKKAAAPVPAEQSLGTEPPPPPAAEVNAGRRKNLLWLGVGLALLVVGADRLVAGAADIARAFGVSELVIGLTVVAVGTSLPELAASLMAARRGEGDLALGNVVGSNLFNLLCVLGGTAALTPVTISPAALGVDLPMMVAVALFTWPLVAAGHRVGRLKGLALMGLYAGYLYWQFALSQGWIAVDSAPTAALALVGLAGILALVVASGIGRGDAVTA